MSVSLGKIMGIPVRIHYTLWFVFLLIAWSLAYGYMPHQYPGLSELTYWTIGITSAIVLFVSVLVHELSHSYIAKKNGLPIARITLFFFGGVSEMTEEPRDPGLEVRMAAAGPLMSFLIAGILGAIWYVGQAAHLPIIITATVGYGALINAVLGAFNLLPAFPLDGGQHLSREPMETLQEPNQRNKNCNPSQRSPFTAYDARWFRSDNFWEFR